MCPDVNSCWTEICWVCGSVMTYFISCSNVLKWIVLNDTPGCTPQRHPFEPRNMALNRKLVTQDGSSFSFVWSWSLVIKKFLEYPHLLIIADLRSYLSRETYSLEGMVLVYLWTNRDPKLVIPILLVSKSLVFLSFSMNTVPTFLLSIVFINHPKNGCFLLKWLRPWSFLTKN